MRLLGLLSVALAISGVVACGSSTTRPVAANRGATSGTVRGGIALDRRIGVVTFAEPRGQVVKALGRGVWARLQGHRLRFYPKAGIYVAYAPYRRKDGTRGLGAFFVITRSDRYETSVGVGVGSSLRQLRRGVKVRCYAGQDVCQHERANINLPFTVFNIDRSTSRVVEVAIVAGGD